MIWIKKLMVGATLYRSAWGKITSLNVFQKFKFKAFPASHWPLGIANIAPLQTSERYAEVKTIKATEAATKAKAEAAAKAEADAAKAEAGAAKAEAELLAMIGGEGATPNATKSKNKNKSKSNKKSKKKNKSGKKWEHVQYSIFQNFTGVGTGGANAEVESTLN